jgi:hypothetical protein
MEIEMNEQQTTAKAGKLLCMDRGEYSEYQVTGFFVVLRDFNPRAELDEYLAANPEQRESYSFEQDGYLAALMAKGLLLEVEYGTLYLGAYSSHESFSFTPTNEG